MNIKQLEHLLALAQTGSFVRAADRLFITQSALSRSIQGLEEELGGKLVDRIGKRNELTPLGHDVVARARSIIHEAAELRRSAELMQQGGGGAIRSRWNESRRNVRSTRCATTSRTTQAPATVGRCQSSG